MNTKLHLLGIALMGAAALGMTASCSEDDEPASAPPTEEDGTGGTDTDGTETSTLIASATITNGNYTAYDSWTYVNLATGETAVQADATDWIYTNDSIRSAYDPGELGIDWHIAIHRYEIKTNGGHAYDTGLTDMAAVTELPTGVAYTDDSQETYGTSSLEVITDMSLMMQGLVGYSAAPQLNTVLCAWVTRTETGSMPPTIYEPTGHVYVVSFDDGTWAKLRFTAAGNTESGSSGYITWNYELHSNAD